MSDPKATKMTLEEAVEIDRECGFDSGMAARIGRERTQEWHRDRAIVDQAVKAHKALIQYADLPATAAIHDQFGAKNKWMDAVEKLRALERGESEEVHG